MNKSKILEMYELIFEAERKSYNVLPDAKCLADFEKTDKEFFNLMCELGSLRYKIYEYCKKEGIK